MADKRWKRAKREIASLLGGDRLPNSGHGQPDVIAGNLAVQVQPRTTLPAWLIEAVDQQLVVVLNLVGQGRKAQRLLGVDQTQVLTLDDLTASEPSEAKTLAADLRAAGALGQFVIDLFHTWNDLSRRDRLVAAYVWELAAGAHSEQVVV